MLLRAPTLVLVLPLVKRELQMHPSTEGHLGLLPRLHISLWSSQLLFEDTGSSQPCSYPCNTASGVRLCCFQWRPRLRCRQTCPEMI